jgi:biotin carboxyl carrier protein
MRYFVTLGTREISVDVTPLPGGGFSVSSDGKAIAVDAAPAGGALSLVIDGQVVDVVLAGSAPDVGFAVFGSSGGATIETDRTRASAARAGSRGGSGQDFVVAPMPGRVVRILVAAGDHVEIGTPMIVVEAMKMENELRAPRGGIVAEIRVAEGASVEANTVLVVLR